MERERGREMEREGGRERDKGVGVKSVVNIPSPLNYYVCVLLCSYNEY